MRTSKKQPDYGAISRASVKRDMKKVQIYPTEEKVPQIEKQPEINAERRIIFVNENSAYFRYRSYIVGKLVRLIERSNMGGWRCSFVYDDDRKALNNAANWSDNKKEYIFDGIKFK